MRSISRLRAAGALAVVAALAAPAVAAGHGSVIEGTAKVVVPNSDPVALADQTQYFVTNHGYSFVFREDNGALDHGMVNYKVLPGAYRRSLTVDRILAEGDTGVQPHATCRGVAALESVEAITAWQDRDPFYDYVPFQTASAGLEDDPALWIAVVRARTGLDLTAVGDLGAACATLGGAYTPADGIVSRPDALASGTLADTTAPLNRQIAELGRARAALEGDVARLTGERATLTGEKGTLTRLLDAARAEIATLVAAARPLTARAQRSSVTGRSLAANGTTVAVTGPPSRRVTVRLSVGALRAKALRLPSAVLARGTVTLAADGRGTVALRPARRAARALRSIRRGARMTIQTTSGDRIATARVTVTR